jgi:enoyl-CoA hydratase/carnithine racemase
MDDLSVVTITGAGPEFAVGRQSPPDDVRDADLAGRLSWLDNMRVSQSIAGLPMPVIAAVNGDATAHGLEIALAADLRIIAADAIIGAGGINEFGFPFDGATQRLPRLVGPAHARDLLLTGRLLDADAALEIGLVNRVVSSQDLRQATDDLAQSIVESAPIACRFAKEAVTAASDLTLGQGLRLEADLNIILHSTADRAEGLRSFREKRSPQYTGR